MESVRLTEALGYTVGDRLEISAEAFDARVVRTTPRRVLVEWPWWEMDPESANRWDGTVGFPRDPDTPEWNNTPWRVEPDPSELETGDNCFVGIPPTQVTVTAIRRYEPPADLGIVPRPECELGLVPIGLEDEEEAGYVLYLNGAEPVEITML